METGGLPHSLLRSLQPRTRKVTWSTGAHYRVLSNIPVTSSKRRPSLSPCTISVANRRKVLRPTICSSFQKDGESAVETREEPGRSVTPCDDKWNEGAGPVWLRAVVAFTTWALGGGTDASAVLEPAKRLTPQEDIRASAAANSSKQEPPPEEANDEGLFNALLESIRSDYSERMYFVTGDISDGYYTEDCTFIDATISFSGLQLWKRNIGFLRPFLLQPSIDLTSIRLVEEDGQVPQVHTTWHLRSFIRLPWTPLVDVRGVTVHYINSDSMKIFRHEETWEVSAIDAVMQLFKPADYDRLQTLE